MTIRFRAALCLPLLLVSCDEQKKAGKTADEAPTENRVTKSGRHGLEERKRAYSERRSALAAVTDLPSAEERNRKLAEWIWEAWELDPELAREGLDKLTPGSEERNRLIQHHAMQLAEGDLEEAKSWASSLGTDEDKSIAFGRIALVISEKDPEGAARLLSDSGVAGREFDVAVVQVVQRWAGAAPASAADWVVRFDNSETRKAGLKAITSSWMTIDPEASLSWISSLGDEGMRQEAISGYAEAVLEQPDMIQDEMLRSASPEMQTRFEELEARAREAEAEAAEEEEN